MYQIFICFVIFCPFDYGSQVNLIIIHFEPGMLRWYEFCYDVMGAESEH